MSVFSNGKDIFDKFNSNNQEVASIYCSLKKTLDKKSPQNLNELLSLIKDEIIQNQFLPNEYVEKYIDNYMHELSLDLLLTTKHMMMLYEQGNEKKEMSTNNKIMRYLKAQGSHSNCFSLSPKISVCRRQIKKDFEDNYLKMSLKAIHFFKAMGLLKNGQETKEIRIILESIDEIYAYDHYSQFIYNPHNAGIQIKNVYNLANDFLNMHTGKKKIGIDQEIAAYLYERIFFTIQYSKCFASYFEKCEEKVFLSTRPMKLLTHVKMYDTCFMSFSDYLQQQYDVLKVEDNLESLEEAYCISQLCLKYNLPILQFCIKKIIFEIYNEKLEELKKSLEKIIYNRCLLDSKAEFSYYKKMRVALDLINEGSYKTGKKFIGADAVKTGSKEYIINIVMSKMFYGKEDLEGWFYQYKNGDAFYEFVTNHYYGLNDYYKDKRLRDLI